MYQSTPHKLAYLPFLVWISRRLTATVNSPQFTIGQLTANLFLTGQLTPGFVGGKNLVQNTSVILNWVLFEILICTNSCFRACVIMVICVFRRNKSQRDVWKFSFTVGSQITCCVWHMHDCLLTSVILSFIKIVTSVKSCKTSYLYILSKLTVLWHNLLDIGQSKVFDRFGWFNGVTLTFKIFC